MTARPHANKLRLLLTAVWGFGYVAAMDDKPQTTEVDAMDPKYVIVTTAHRGIFFGQLAANEAPESVTLTGCRNVIYFAGQRGFLGLAQVGPAEGSKVGSTAPAVTLYDITSTAECTSDAVATFVGWPEPS